jgi:hypothetical protein
MMSSKLDKLFSSGSLGRGLEAMWEGHADSSLMASLAEP